MRRKFSVMSFRGRGQVRERTAGEGEDSR